MHVADVVEVAEQHHPAVESQGNAAVGWSPVLQRVEQEAEAFLRRRFVNSQ